MKLGDVLRKWRTMADIPVCDVAKDMGISTATLSRVERGFLPSGKVLAAIMAWMLRPK